MRTGHSVLKYDLENSRNGDDIKSFSEIEKFVEHSRNDFLVPNRLDHMWSMVVEDRRWEKVSKREYKLAFWFNFDELTDQLHKFHRPNQPKRMGKKYVLKQ